MSQTLRPQQQESPAGPPGCHAPQAPKRGGKDDDASYISGQTIHVNGGEVVNS